jgi:hypothetical protein
MLPGTNHSGAHLSPTLTRPHPPTPSRSKFDSCMHVCRVLSARCSLDRGCLALQRSSVLVELVDLRSGNISVMARWE